MRKTQCSAQQILTIPLPMMLKPIATIWSQTCDNY